jgi:hypothetical protein
MKRISIAALSFIAVALFFAASAFTKNNAEKQTVYEHFQYIGSSYNEADFENDANWISLGTTNPSTNPCTTSGSRVCVAKVDQSQLSTNPFLTLPEKMELFLINEASADTYVNTAGNQTHTKP